MSGASLQRGTAHPLARRANRFRRQSLQAAAIGLASGAAAESASATIIYDLAVDATPADGDFSVDGTTNGEIELSRSMAMMAWDLTLEATPGMMMDPGSSALLHTVPAGMDDDLVLLTGGETVDGSLAYTSEAFLVDGGVPSAGWNAGATGYAGFSFDNGGVTNYGWLQIRLGASLDDFTVLQWAYDDSGGSIPVGSIPEPSTALLVGLGLAAVAGWRRRRAGRPRSEANP